MRCIKSCFYSLSNQCYNYVYIKDLLFVCLLAFGKTDFHLSIRSNSENSTKLMDTKKNTNNTTKWFWRRIYGWANQILAMCFFELQLRVLDPICFFYYHRFKPLHKAKVVQLNVIFVLKKVNQKPISECKFFNMQITCWKTCSEARFKIKTNDKNGFFIQIYLREWVFWL